MSKPVKIGNQTFNLDSITQVMTISEADTGKHVIVTEVGPFQAAGLCFAQVEMDQLEGIGNAFKITSVLPVRLDHWAEVESSQIARVAYDWPQQLLKIEFHSRPRKDGSLPLRSVYRYFDVPAAVVGEMLFSPSVGVAFGVLIKNGGYAFGKEDA